jgi:dihydrofolate synthase/folylpolyglutamate synthase
VASKCRCLSPSTRDVSQVDSILTRLLALHPKRIDLSLDRLQRLLAALDHPERKLPPVIHIAGTNGKGSTTAFLRAILEAAGLRVHAYTSPHLVNFNERFRIGAVGEGKLVSDSELSAALEECEAANGGEPITVFEMTTAAGVLLFARNPADVLLLEVGLGGRLDATNVIDTPLARRSSRRYRSITSTFSAIRLPRSLPRRPASSRQAPRSSLPRSIAMRSPLLSGKRRG